MGSIRNRALGVLLGIALLPSAAWAMPLLGLGESLSMAHSHNDYEQQKPLTDALARGFSSVEADLWYEAGEIVVSHSGLDVKGTLRELYLEPLRKRIAHLGSVYGDEKPFILWLDLKSRVPEMLDQLHVLLQSYRSLFSAQGPLKIVFTGNEQAKARFVELHPSAAWSRDSNDFDPFDPPADGKWQWYSLDWDHFCIWNGRGELPLVEELRLSKLIELIHDRGRKIRFYGTPDTPEVWARLKSLGADLIDTDKLSELSAFLSLHRVVASF